jgi:transposase-like protein
MSNLLAIEVSPQSGFSDADRSDHRNVKRLTRPGLGFGSFWTARRTLAGYEAMGKGWFETSAATTSRLRQHSSPDYFKSPLDR